MRRRLVARIEFDFDFLFYRDGGQVVAHCLQTDTAAQGDDVDSAKLALRRALELEISAALEADDLESVYALPAPESVWDRINESASQRYVLEQWALTSSREQYPARIKDHILADVA